MGLRRPKYEEGCLRTSPITPGGKVKQKIAVSHFKFLRAFAFHACTVKYRLPQSDEPVYFLRTRTASKKGMIQWTPLKSTTISLLDLEWPAP